MKDYVKDNVPKVNRQYQDSLFRFMFSDKESAIELYNAIEGTDYGLDTEVVFTTLDDVLYEFFGTCGKNHRCAIQ